MRVAHTYRSQVLWLMVTCVLIWFMILLGGATRLTRSGLSIVEWKPLTGILPPLSLEAWEAEFHKYKQFPEFQQLHTHFTLADFKFIYGMEYTHRLLGRLIGLVFFIPLIFFWIRGTLHPLMRHRVIPIFLIGGLQGFIGWYMVKSGLINSPHVSHYRLVAHLALAVLLLAFILWSVFQMTEDRQHPLLKGSSLQRWAHISTFLIFLTLIYGGLVAGLKAGLHYNTFPLMNEAFLPEDWRFLTPLPLNFIENPSLVQFIHRWLGISTLFLVGITVTQGVNAKSSPLRQACWLFLLTAIIQVALGLLTLLLQVPVLLAILHQGAAVILFSLGLWVMYLSRYETRTTLNAHDAS